MGRTQTFDEETVIKKALAVFWEKGYNETSLDDLLKATGLHKGSLYRSFQSKENLFLLALNQYGTDSKEYHIGDEDPAEYLKGFFIKLIEESCRSSKGCFIMNSCIELGANKDLLAKVSKQLFESIKGNFRKAVELAESQGQLEKGVSVDELATRLVGAAFSIRELSKFQRDRMAFEAIANGVLKEVGKKV